MKPLVWSTYHQLQCSQKIVLIYCWCCNSSTGGEMKHCLWFAGLLVLFMRGTAAEFSCSSSELNYDTHTHTHTHTNTQYTNSYMTVFKLNYCGLAAYDCYSPKQCVYLSLNGWRLTCDWCTVRFTVTMQTCLLSHKDACRLQLGRWCLPYCCNLSTCHNLCLPTESLRKDR